MKRSILFLMVCVASFLAVKAQSGDAAYEAELDKAVTLSCDRQVFVETFENSFRQFVGNGTITAAQCREMSGEMADLLYPKICSLVKEMWRNEFSLDELKQVVAWLSSPVGKKMLQMTVKLGPLQQSLLQDPEIINGITGIVAKYTK